MVVYTKTSNRRLRADTVEEIIATLITREQNPQINNTTGSTTVVTEASSVTHNILSATHADTLAATVIAGDIIYGNSTPAWARLAKGTVGQVLQMGASLPAWVDAIKLYSSGINKGEVFMSGGNLTLRTFDNASTLGNRWQVLGDQASYGHLVPVTDNFYDIGGAILRARTEYLMSLNLYTILNLQNSSDITKASVSLGGGTNLTLATTNLAGTLGGSWSIDGAVNNKALRPAADNTHDIGSFATRAKDIYVMTSKIYTGIDFNNSSDVRKASIASLDGIQLTLITTNLAAALTSAWVIDGGVNNQAFYPEFDNATDIGKTTKRVKKLWAVDIDYSGALSGTLPTHNILSASHGDTLAASAVAGDIIIGNATPKWARLPKGTDGQVLTLVTGLPAWAAAGGGSNHAILSSTHTDTVAATVVAGDIMYGNSTPAWQRLAKGSNGEVLKLVSGLPAWGQVSVEASAPDLFYNMGFIVPSVVSATIQDRGGWFLDQNGGGNSGAGNTGAHRDSDGYYIQSITTSTINTNIGYEAAADNIEIGFGFEVLWKFGISHTTTIRAIFGVFDASIFGTGQVTTDTIATNGLFLRYSSAVDTNFMFVRNDGGTGVAVDTGIAVDIATHYLRIKASAGTITITLYDNAFAQQATATYTTSIPSDTLGLRLQWGVQCLAAAATRHIRVYGVGGIRGK